MIDWVAFGKYAGVIGTIIATGFGLPLPEEVAIVTAGAMVGHDAQEAWHAGPVGGLGGGAAYAWYRADHEYGATRWYLMLPACIVAVVIGDGVLYAAGRLFGDRLLASAFVRTRILPPDKRAKIEHNFRTRGVMILLAARFTPGIRTPVFLMSGVLKMPVRQFLLADGLYAIPGVSLLFWLAYLFTDQFVEAVHAVERHRPMAVAVVLAAVLGVLGYRFVVNRRLATGDPDGIPPLVKPVGAAAAAVEKAVERAVEKTVESLSHGRKPGPEPRGPTDG